MEDDASTLASGVRLGMGGHRLRHAGAGRLALRSGVMPANRMNRDEFYAAMAPHDDARLRKILWTVYWRGNAQLRERIEDELRPQDQPKVKAKKELPDPAGVLDEVTTFIELARDGAYMAGDRRVHHTERSRWRHTVPQVIRAGRLRQPGGGRRVCRPRRWARSRPPHPPPGFRRGPRVASGTVRRRGA